MAVAEAGICAVVKINLAVPNNCRTFAVEFNALKMMNTFVDTSDDTDVMEMQDDFTPEERDYWEASIERDMRNRAEGRKPKYISGDEFWSKLEEAVMRHYERVQA